MAQTPEKKVKNKIVALFKELGVWYCTPATFGMGRSGVPDFLCCVNGYFLAVEAKAAGNTTTAWQDKELHAIRSAGGSAVVIAEDDLDKLRGTIMLLKQAHDPNINLR